MDNLKSVEHKMVQLQKYHLSNQHLKREFYFLHNTFVVSSKAVILSPESITKYRYYLLI